MQYRIAFVTLLAGGASALPNFLHIRQGVTEDIAPADPAPPGFIDTVPGTFGIAVLNVTANGDSSPTSANNIAVPPATQVSDGQPQQGTAPPESQISDGQPQGDDTAVVTMGRITQINDGQIQAPPTHAPVTVTPVPVLSDGQPQASLQTQAPAAPGPTIISISDGQIQAPATSAPPGPVVTQISDGQIQAPGPQTTVPVVAQSTDGQPEAPKPTMTLASVISDGQVQAPGPQTTETPVPELSDGQPQASAAATGTVIPDAQVQAPGPQTTETPVPELGDGQPQASVAATGTVIPDAQVQAPRPQQTVSQISDGQIQAPGPQATETPVPEFTDGQPQAPAATPETSSDSNGGATQLDDGQVNAPVDQSSDGQIQARSVDLVSRSAMGLVGCQTDSTLTLTLTDGILKDNQGRTGYIASNRQFQFDKPAQAGAIYTAGWSMAPNGSLALGPSTIFYQCLSGTFYNLYDQNVAPQCNAVTINTLMLEKC